MRIACAGVIVLLVTTITNADTAIPPATQPVSPTTQAVLSAFDPARHMLVSEVKPGMKGYGLSVFSGRKIERFELNVIGVHRNFGPSQDVVLIRLLGDQLEHTGVIAGMSGSPIFLTDEKGHDRMIGALAYGWSLSKDPIAGVQPIEYMLKLKAQPQPTDKPASAPAGRAPDGGAGKMSWVVQPASWEKFTEQFRKQGGATRMTALSTPLMTAGVSPDVMKELSPAFDGIGLVPLQAGVGGPATQPAGDAAGFAPGSALVVPLATGDLDLSALGTCTEVLGDRVYGFGHPFQNEGPVALPLASGYVTTIIPTLSISFKLGGYTDILGTLAADQSVGVAGKVGPAPQMIPVDIDVEYADGSFSHTYHYNLAVHPMFTPLLGTMVIMSSVTADKQLPQYHTLDMDMTLDFRNGKSVHISNTTPNSSVGDLFGEIGTPIVAASDNPFERVVLKSIKGKLTVLPEVRTAQVLDVNIPRTKYLPGETVKAYVTYRPFRAAEAILPIEMTIPADLPDGKYSLAVSDWSSYLSQERQTEPFRFTTENVDQVFAVLKEMAAVRRNALYVRLTRKPDGVAVGRTAMPRLPSSRKQVLLDAGRSNTTEFVSSTVKVVPSNYVFEGDTSFDIEVDRNARADRPHKQHEGDKGEKGDKGKAPAKPTTAPGN